MRSSACRPVLVLGSILVSAAALAASSPRAGGPNRFVVPALDGPPVVVENPLDGRAFSAWAYRSGGEFDLAVSIRDAAGVWARPVFLGTYDRADQTEPALAVDRNGHAYLAFSSSDSGRVFVSVLPFGRSSWSTPIAVTRAGLCAAAPALSIVGNRLVVGFRSGASVELVDLPLHVPGVSGLGIQDGPDPVGHEKPESGGDSAPFDE